MSWVKRNLGFVIGSVVALALMGLAGWYLYSKWELNNSTLENLNKDYETLKELNGKQPHPGSGGVDNIKTAKEQQDQLQAFRQQTRKHFQRIARIPDLPKITDRDFAFALSRTIEQLQRDATNSSVSLPPKYSFSFEAQRAQMSFSTESLSPLSTRLGEVKAICDVVFQAKINSLDYLRRERILNDTNDYAGNLNDYTPEKSVTNDLAVLTPYELGFRCFSSELAMVLAGFATSPYGFIVKSINVEQAPQVAVEPSLAVPPPAAVYVPAPVPLPVPVPSGPVRGDSEAAAFARRYGLNAPGGKARLPYETALGAQPAYTPPAVAPQAPAAAAIKPGLTTVLDEKQLKITMLLEVVKLIEPKSVEKKK